MEENTEASKWIYSCLSCASLQGLPIRHVWPSRDATLLKLDLGRPGGQGPLTVPNKSFLGSLSVGILNI